MAVEKKYPPVQALARLRRYCAYQERAHAEVREKLRGWGYWGAAADELIAKLIEEGFLDEQRFAETWARGKWRQKGWGRRKIEAGLRARGMNDWLVAKALAQLDESGYRAKLEEVLDKKMRLAMPAAPLELKAKLVRFALTKGYETELVYQTVERMVARAKPQGKRGG